MYIVYFLYISVWIEVASSKKCVKYNEHDLKKCDNIPNCTNYEECDNQHPCTLAYHFHKDGTYTPKQAYCAENNECSSESRHECVLKPVKHLKDVIFGYCCCMGNLCNKNVVIDKSLLIWGDDITTPSTNDPHTSFTGYILFSLFLSRFIFYDL